MDRARRAFAPQALAVYDAMCMYGAGVACVGMGTREFCLKTTLRGMDFASLLPPGTTPTDSPPVLHVTSGRGHRISI